MSKAIKLTARTARLAQAALLPAGAAVIAFGLAADRLGLGLPEFGARQQAAVLAGLGLLLAGFALRPRFAALTRPGLLAVGFSLFWLTLAAALSQPERLVISLAATAFVALGLIGQNLLVDEGRHGNPTYASLTVLLALVPMWGLHPVLLRWRLRHHTSMLIPASAVLGVSYGLPTFTAWAAARLPRPYVKLLQALLGMLGLGLFWVALTTPQVTPPDRFAASLAAAVLIANAFTLQRATAQSEGQALAYFGLAFAALVPTWALQTIVSGFYSQLGLHRDTLISAAAIYGLPLILAWLLTRLPPRRVRKSLANTLLALASVLLSLGALEVGVKRLGLDPAAHDDWIKGVGEYKRVGKPSRFPPNHVWGHRYSSNERGYFDEGNVVMYRMNSTGFRDEEFSPERDPSVLRIAFLGDSFGFGWGVKVEDTAAVLLEGLLSEQVGCPVEVYNFSMPGYSTRSHARLLSTEVMDYQPDVVVIWYFLNDIRGRGLKTRRYLGRNNEQVFFPALRKSSALVRFVAVRLDAEVSTQRMVERYHIQYSASSQEWQELNTYFQQIADEVDVPVVLLVHPILHRLNASYPFADIHHQVVTTAREHGFIAYDMFDAFKGQRGESLWVHPVDQHPNEIAHALAANYAAERIAPHLPACGSDSS